MNIIHLDTPQDRAKWQVKVKGSRLLSGEKGLFAWNPNKRDQPVFRAGDKIEVFDTKEVAREL